MTTNVTSITPNAPLTPYHRMELERVVTIANSRLAVLPGMHRFAVAPMKGDAHHREYLTQIRADPSTGADGVEFRYSLPLRQSGCASFDELAWDLVGQAYRFLADTQFVNLGASARKALEPVMAAAEAATIAPRLVAVGVCFEYAHAKPSICADIEMLGNDLVLGIERVVGSDVAHLECEVVRSVENHGKRDAARRRAEDAGASGWIDQTALRLIDAAGLDRRETIALVAKEGWVNILFTDVDGRRLDGTLHHSNGVIEGSIMPRSRSWSLRRGDLIIWGADLPMTLQSSLAGRLIGEIFPNPELPPHARVTLVDEVTSVDPESDDDEDDQVDGWLRLMLDVPTTEIDRATGGPRETWSPSPKELNKSRAESRS